jgi:ABC-2 type transport system permease protein
MIDLRRLRALVWKELVDLGRNRGALVPVVVSTVVFLALPLLVAVVLPRTTGRPLGDDADLARASLAVGAYPDLTDNGRVQLFLFQQFLLVFLLLPITGAMSLAAHAVVGEKLARTLEPLLATPITTAELLVGKVLGALIPTFAIGAAGFVVYLGVVAASAEPGVVGSMLGARTAVLMLVIAPASALVALQAALIISSRVNDPRTAQQFGVLIIVPLVALLIAQFTGSLWLSATELALIGAALAAVWVVLTLFSVAIFDRETILTRWK